MFKIVFQIENVNNLYNLGNGTFIPVSSSNATPSAYDPGTGNPNDIDYFSDSISDPMYVGNWVFENNGSSTIKDLEKLTAKKEDLKKQLVKQNLIDNYSLSEEKAESLATLHQQWRKVKSQNKSLTQTEKKYFSQSIFGYDLSGANNSELLNNTNELIQKAADYNGVSVENLLNIFGTN